ncbi:hypothetical protein [Methylobacterium nigriterrae]|uniref:hypothetical protein n=1 Tax=Methylobacterium nigriterrae TaxID=3127512 RepID=UPI0030141A17
MHRIFAAGLFGLVILPAGSAAAGPALDLTVRPGLDNWMPDGGVEREAFNPNVTRSNPMGVVGWDGPPGGTTSVIGDDAPLPPGSIAATPDDPITGPGLR